MVEVKTYLITGASDRLIAGELELLNEILMRVLGKLSALIGIKEDIVDVERSSDKGLLVSLGDTLRTRCGGEGLDSPQALTNRSDVEVDLDFVILYESLEPLLSKYLCRETKV